MSVCSAGEDPLQAPVARTEAHMGSVVNIMHKRQEDETDECLVFAAMVRTMMIKLNLR